MLRLPAVAGRFYPSNAEELWQQVDAMCGTAAEAPRTRALACMVPHAGYRFSGQVAGAVYARLDLPRRFLLIGPRHYRQGAAQAILSDGAWQTPLGRVEIDAGLAAELKRACGSLAEDVVAHQSEHALEVQLPFLQRLAGNVRFVPIALGTGNLAELEALGRAIAEVVGRASERVLIVASSDMNHYESDEITRVKDRMALDRVLALDPRGLHETIRREGITMCGFGAAVSMLTAARQLGARRAELVRYATSGDINGDRDSVVGYAGVIID